MDEMWRVLLTESFAESQKCYKYSFKYVNVNWYLDVGKLDLTCLGSQFFSHGFRTGQRCPYKDPCIGAESDSPFDDFVNKLFESKALYFLEFWVVA